MSARAFLDGYLARSDEPRIYWLNRYKPIAMRDQFVRAALLVDALVAECELDAAARVVILGAGLAGAVAAIAIAEWADAEGVDLRHRVRLIESGPAVLGRQLGNVSRWIDPVEYDWPAAHWDHAGWPIANRFGPESRESNFLIVADDADGLATRFRTALDTHVERIEQIVGHRYLRHRGAGGRYRVTVGSNDGDRELDVDLLLVATGFGEERASIATASGGRFESVKYWANDTFRSRHFGIPTLGRAHAPPVIVSGTGDGGLQDWIRLLTGAKSPADVWRAIAPHLGATRKYIESIWHWEQDAVRTRVFFAETLDECELYGRLHAVYEEAIAHLVESDDWPPVQQALVRLLEANKKTAPRHVMLVSKGDHFHACFPLNRFVALVLIAFEEGRTGSSPLLTGRAVKSTTAEHGGGCSNGCWGLVHSVTMARGVSCRTSDEEIERWAGQTDTRRVRGIVIRHGFDESGFGGMSMARAPVSAPMNHWRGW